MATEKELKEYNDFLGKHLKRFTGNNKVPTFQHWKKTKGTKGLVKKKTKPRIKKKA